MNDRGIWAAGLLAAALAVGSVAQAAPASDPTFGEWLTATGDGRVKVGPCAANPAQACGTLIWLKPPADAPPGPLHDANNPNPALRSRPMLGILIVSDFTREAAGQWVDGKIYDPNDGKTYKSKMSVSADGTLKVSGCVMVFCKAQTWTKAP
jgi:uncharacterized protein (DUF2147 family)